MTKRMSALVAPALVPIAFGLLVASPDAIGKMMIEGVTKLAPTGVMLTFGILYFSVMTDAGLFDPLIRMIARVVGHDPHKLLLGTAIMGTLVALDGDGATTYVICITALLPIYRRLGVRLQYMATVLLMSIGIMNIVPWGGPTARAASAMHIDVTEVFVPLIPVMLMGFIYQLGVASYFGIKDASTSWHSSHALVRSLSRASSRRIRRHTTDSQRASLLWVFGLVLEMLAAALLLGVIPLIAIP